MQGSRPRQDVESFLDDPSDASAPCARPAGDSEPARCPWAGPPLGPPRSPEQGDFRVRTVTRGDESPFRAGGGQSLENASGKVEAPGGIEPRYTDLQSVRARHRPQVNGRETSPTTIA